MATYIVLGNFTEQGIRTVKDGLKRTDHLKEMAKKAGVTVKETYWTLGQYDVIGIFDAPDDASMTTFGLAIGATGNVRTNTLRAFSADEFKSILGRLPTA
jgi:uncharacterized protein with GYD domain